MTMGMCDVAVKAVTYHVSYTVLFEEDDYHAMKVAK